MHGPDIVARSLTATNIPDKFGNVWQYHSQSDRHSKVLCWAVLFDLLLDCPLLRVHAGAGVVGFGINHEMQDFQTRRKKDLDLVVCTPNSSVPPLAKADSYSDLATKIGIRLTPAQAKLLRGLPRLRRVPVGSVNLALEAKATMTAHVKALPRLHDELDSSHLTIHGSADHALAAAIVLVNAAKEFASPKLNQRVMEPGAALTMTLHRQPRDAERTIEKVLEIRRRVQSNQAGFDAVGILVIDFRNDGSACTVVDLPPAPSAKESHHYGQMIRRLGAAYTAKFATL